MKIAFHLYFMTLRGTEVATYDFARYNEEILGNESIIIFTNINALKARKKPSEFEAFTQGRDPLRFRVYEYYNHPFTEEGQKNIAEIMDHEHCMHLYNHELFSDSTWAIPHKYILVHATFRWCPAHGDRFIHTSEWLARPTGNQYVPLIVDLPQVEGDMREELGIPQEARVFGRYGGATTFSIPFVHDTIHEIVHHNKDIYFLFMNTNTFMPKHPQVIHLPGSSDNEVKSRFINTADAMLHARLDGETFGLAVAEFSIHNKPVITYAHPPCKAHIEQLGRDALLYEQASDLYRLLENFRPCDDKNWDHYSEQFSPQPVMEAFNEKFLNL